MSLIDIDNSWKEYNLTLAKYAPLYLFFESFTLEGNDQMNVTLFHNDHGISAPIMTEIYDSLAEMKEDGFFIKQVNDLDSIPCGLWGPAMGDAPITESEVHYSNRGLDREWEDRMCRKGNRPVDYAQVIGVKEGENVKIFTVYGGPLAPQNANDPSNQNPKESEKFWAEHALNDPTPKGWDKV